MKLENSADSRPLADRLRPQRLEEFFGQHHLLAPGKPLYEAVRAGHLHSMILWGPPGTGKTTLARMVAATADAEFIPLSAVLSNIQNIRQAIQQAEAIREQGRRTILFVDEVHRFNKAQQDAFLPHIETGLICFIGATTENPSFALNNALLSRARVYVLKPLGETDLEQVIDRALTDPCGFGGREIRLPAAVRPWLIQAADGDARRLLNLLEVLVDLGEEAGGVVHISEAVARDVLAGGSPRRFDRQGDAFYDQISALHKTIRGSDPDAALYWLCRMLDGGCDPLYIARRLVRIASEDIGNADPRALRLALDAWDAQERLGSPEGELALAQAAVYLACAPKSNAVYRAFQAAQRDAAATGSLEVPVHLRNAPTRLMRELGYGRRYRYAHDEPEGYAAGENYFPEEMEPRRYYQPVERGLEIKIAAKLQRLSELDRLWHQRHGPSSPDTEKSRRKPGPEES
ncbi:putative ATPase [Methylomarinovum caldicuralii]|uniref:Replication-associated recombination protein A n=1 Tax=Methylomarinovum caldicuralii TaxID=438856 RepID=A0AAU9C7A6_9GAMM|nr:replication-associated recombination protein A [Methylomarinovum caldicuralii]BCX81899.1 putative ATPase [Methylomarinovum caldicuralii]